MNAGTRSKFSVPVIFLWALLRHVPEVVANPHGVVLTNAGKALALCGGALGVTGALPAEEAQWWHVSRALNRATDGLVRVGRVSLGAFMMLGGVQHFMYPQFVASLVPAWIPGPMFWTYFAGVALVAGGAGMMLTRTARLAAALSGLMILLWVVTLHVPRALGALAAQRRNEWTAVFEALAFSGIALSLPAPFAAAAQLAVAAPDRPELDSRRFLRFSAGIAPVSRFGGLSHNLVWRLTKWHASAEAASDIRADSDKGAAFWSARRSH